MGTHSISGILVLLILISFAACRPAPSEQAGREAFADTLEQSLHEDVVERWYPRAVDSLHGGFLTHFAHDWAPLEPQRKFIVTEARHLWTTARMHAETPRPDSLYLNAARQGVEFLREKMWDEERGGFYSLVNREGEVQQGNNEFTGIKTAYGNAFAIYGLTSAYQATGDTVALNQAQRTFHWLDEHAHDDEHGGYFQSLHVDGSPYVDGYDDSTPPKDQNSTIHLLEALTALYEAAPDTPGLQQRLQELLVLTRGTMVRERGSLRRFFECDWTPVSYRDSSMAVREENYYLDHLSFGHDVETAYLMLDAAEALGQDPQPTLEVGKRMVDHALENGWDAGEGGLYDGGFVIGSDSVRIARSTKSWWVQAEALHVLLLMEEHYPDDRRDYGAKARATWDYIDRYLVDHEHGGWYVRGLDESPDARSEPKGTIWKASYHNVRALLRAIEILGR